MRRILAAAAVMAVAAAVYVVAQPPSLDERIQRLKAEVEQSPTTDANFIARARVLEDWADRLVAQKKFRAAQDLMSMSVRGARGLRNVTPDEGVKNWVKRLTFYEANGDKTGVMRRVDQNKLVAGDYTTVVFEYTVGEIEIGTGGMLRIGQKFISNRPRLQSIDAGADSYTTFRVEGSQARVQTTVSNWNGVFGSIFGAPPCPALRVVSGTLKRGDKVIITIGDTSAGSGKGYRPLPRDADEYEFMLEMDRGDGLFVEAAVASTKILGDEAALINAVAPSVVAVNEPFAVRLRIEDQYLNPAQFEGGTFDVLLNGAKVGSINVASGRYTGKAEGIKIAAEGAYKFEVRSTDGRFRCASNPVLAEKDPKQRIYWGELHGHSGWEEGTGSVPGYYEFARDVAFLDFGSLTGHDAFLAGPGWQEIRRETEKANKAGEFVAYMGYEWTQSVDKGGHHNVFFKTDKGRYVQTREAPSPKQLYAKLREVDSPDNVLIIPHAHEAGDWTVNDPDMERLIEVYSGHGSFEYFGQRFMRRGFRVGVIAASDDHSGHPGYAPALVATRGGLAAVYSPQLDRDGIWKGMKDRATYATSGKRPVVKMTLDGKLPGDAAPAGGIPTINARALASSAIDRIDVMRNGEVEYSKEFLTTAAGEAGAIQLMFFSPTETPGESVQTPQGSVYWGVWATVTGAKIESVQPLGLDAFSDVFGQVDERTVYYQGKTRGDFDGLLLKLAGAGADAKVTLRFSELHQDQSGTGVGRGVNWSSGIPSRAKVAEVSFGVSEVATKKLKFDVRPWATAFARKVSARRPWDGSFTYKPAKAPAANDYFYLRLTEIDGETAWSSPVWIGAKQ